METVTEALQLDVPDGSMDIWTYRPQGDVPRPPIIVIQEAFGVNNHVQELTKRFAVEGYVAVTPDLFHRAGRHLTGAYDGEREERAKFREGMTDTGIVDDLKAVVEYLKANPNVQDGPIGITGYCMGGRVSFLAACSIGEIGAAVIYYGGDIVPADGSAGLIDKANQITSPILGFFGGQDAMIPGSAVEALRSRLNELGIQSEIIIYPDAGHGFFCDDRPSYNAKAASDSWPRTLSFFSKHLKPVGSP